MRAAFHCEPTLPLKPHRVRTQPSAVMGRGATVSPGGTSTRQEEAQLLLQPLHRLRFVTLPCSKASCITFVRKDVTLIFCEDSLLTGSENGKSCLSNLPCAVHQENGAQSFHFCLPDSLSIICSDFIILDEKEKKMREENDVRTLLPAWRGLCEPQHLCCAVGFSLWLLLL